VLPKVLISQSSLISEGVKEIIRAVFFAAEGSGKDVSRCFVEM